MHWGGVKIERYKKFRRTVAGHVGACGLAAHLFHPASADAPLQRLVHFIEEQHGRPVTLVCQRAARPLRALRHAAQPSGASRLLTAASADLVHMPETAQQALAPGGAARRQIATLTSFAKVSQPVT